MIERNAVEATVVSRLDARSGVTESARFIGSGESRIYAYQYLPARHRGSAVVMCPAILGDFASNYRREVVGARELAGRGFAVTRFHYRGAGNSDGTVADLSFDSMVEDALAMADAISEAAGVDEVSFLGTRFGSIVAAAATRARASRSVAMWEPMPDARSYFREMNRSRMMHEVTDGERQGATFDDLAAELREQGASDLLGYTLGRPLFETALDRTLLGELGDHTTDVLLVQFNLRKGIDKSRQALADAMRAAGSTVDLQAVQGVELWGLHAEGWTPIENRTDVQSLLQITADWFTGRAEGDAA